MDDAWINARAQIAALEDIPEAAGEELQSLLSALQDRDVQRTLRQATRALLACERAAYAGFRGPHTFIVEEIAGAARRVCMQHNCESLEGELADLTSRAEAAYDAVQPCVFALARQMSRIQAQDAKSLHLEHLGRLDRALDELQRLINQRHEQHRTAEKAAEAQLSEQKRLLSAFAEQRRQNDEQISELRLVISDLARLNASQTERVLQLKELESSQIALFRAPPPPADAGRKAVPLSEFEPGLFKAQPTVSDDMIRLRLQIDEIQCELLKRQTLFMPGSDDLTISLPSEGNLFSEAQDTRAFFF